MYRHICAQITLILPHSLVKLYYVLPSAGLMVFRIPFFTPEKEMMAWVDREQLARNTSFVRLLSTRKRSSQNSFGSYRNGTVRDTRHLTPSLVELPNGSSKTPSPCNTWKKGNWYLTGFPSPVRNPSSILSLFFQ